MDQSIDALNNFAIDLFRDNYLNRFEIGENTVISSVSVFIALLMTLAGSKGETQNELLNSLNLKSYLNNKDENLLKLHESFNLLTKSLSETNTDKNKILIANKVILNKLNINDSFRNLIETLYQSKIDLVSSYDSFDSLIKETNKWISDLTNNKITNLLDESFKTVSLTLINAIYFNYEWKYEFDETKTEKIDFYLDKNHENSVKVDMMELSDKNLQYYFSKEFGSHILSLPYKNDTFLFNIIYPADENDYLLSNEQNSLVHKLNYELLKKEIQMQTYEKVYLKMPKFVIKKKINLNSLLKNLGIKQAFDSEKADFSDISLTDKLYVQEILHYSYIEVNEKGTEAAAATVVKIVKRSLSPVIHLNLDRPFIYYISHKATGAILFCGSFNGKNEDQKIFKTEL